MRAPEIFDRNIQPPVHGHETERQMLPNPVNEMQVYEMRQPDNLEPKMAPNLQSFGGSGQWKYVPNTKQMPERVATGRNTN